MNAVDMMQYGQVTLMNSVKDLSESAWDVGGVTGVWSVKDIIAHMLSYEHLLAEVLSTFLDGGPTPLVEDMGKLRGEFNDVLVERYKGHSVSELLTEIDEAHKKVIGLGERIPAETYQKNGALPWYGTEYCLDDFIVYANYAHKREHSAEINVYRDRL